jgi:hypothetical protein
MEALHFLGRFHGSAPVVVVKLRFFGNGLSAFGNVIPSASAIVFLPLKGR